MVLFNSGIAQNTTGVIYFYCQFFGQAKLDSTIPDKTTNHQDNLDTHILKGVYQKVNKIYFKGN